MGEQVDPLGRVGGHVRSDAPEAAAEPAGARSNIVEGALMKRVEQMSRQLELGTVDLSTLRRWAAEAGRSQLAAQLASFDWHQFGQHPAKESNGPIEPSAK